MHYSSHVTIKLLGRLFFSLHYAQAGAFQFKFSLIEIAQTCRAVAFWQVKIDAWSSATSFTVRRHTETIMDDPAFSHTPFLSAKPVDVGVELIPAELLERRAVFLLQLHLFHDLLYRFRN